MEWGWGTGLGKGVDRVRGLQVEELKGVFGDAEKLRWGKDEVDDTSDDPRGGEKYWPGMIERRGKESLPCRGERG